MSYLTIRIDKVGLKDPQDYIDPFFRVSVRGVKSGTIGRKAGKSVEIFPFKILTVVKLANLK